MGSEGIPRCLSHCPDFGLGQDILKLTETSDCLTDHCPIQKHACDRDIFDLFLFWGKGKKENRRELKHCDPVLSSGQLLVGIVNGPGSIFKDLKRREFEIPSYCFSSLFIAELLQ